MATIAECDAGLCRVVPTHYGEVPYNGRPVHWFLCERHVRSLRDPSPFMPLAELPQNAPEHHADQLGGSL